MESCEGGGEIPGVLQEFADPSCQIRHVKTAAFLLETQSVTTEEKLPAAGFAFSAAPNTSVKSSKVGRQQMAQHVLHNLFSSPTQLNLFQSRYFEIRGSYFGVWLTAKLSPSSVVYFATA